MNILILGDFMSQAEEKYVFKIAREAGESISTLHLYNQNGIGFEAYHRAFYSNKPECVMGRNGYTSPYKTTVNEALCDEKFDKVILVPETRSSRVYSSYEPFAKLITEKIHEIQPTCEILVLEPYSYPDGAKILTDTLNYKSQDEMAADIHACILRLVEEIEGIDGYIPLVAAQNEAKKQGVLFFDENVKLKDEGSYLASLMIYQAVSKKQIKNNTFKYFYTDIKENDAEKIKDIAYAAAKEVGIR